MDIKNIVPRTKEILGKFKYVLIILIAGILLLLIPENKKTETISSTIPEHTEYVLDESALSKLLSSVDGAGQVQVMLSVSSGEETVYQTDCSNSGTTENLNNKTETVIISDAQRNENGLVSRVNSPVYLGAIIVCQGGDVPSVRLAITQAVSKITGLSTDHICVLKMK